MTLQQTLEMLANLRPGETPEDYKKRTAKMRRYSLERDFLEDAISILTRPEDADKRNKKMKRLARVKKAISELM